MEVSQNFDLVDIKEQLSFKNNLIQAKGFSILVDRILKQVLGQKSDEEHRKVLFDCFNEYGTVPFEYLIESLQTLLHKGVITKQRLLEEFSIRISKIERVERAFPVIIELCQPPYSQFFSLASKIDPETLTKVCIKSEMEEKHRHYISALLFTGLISDNNKRILGNTRPQQDMFLKFYSHLYPPNERSKYDTKRFLEDCSSDELVTQPMNGLDIFQRLELMQERSAIIQNPTFASHILYLPQMFLMSQARQLIVKAVNEAELAEQNKLIRSKLAECQTRSDLVLPDLAKEKLSMETFLRLVVSSNTIFEFISFVENYKEWLPMFRKPHILAILPAIACYSSDRKVHEKIFGLIVNFVKDSPEHADTYVLYLIGLYAKPFFPIDKELILDTLINLAVNRFALAPISTLLCMLAQKGEYRCKALKCLTLLVNKYPSTIETVSKSIKLCPDDPEDVFIAKLQFTKQCCISTDDNDELISSISKLLKENGFRLAAAVDVIQDLIKHDVLELRSVRKQLAKKVSNTGNEKALAAYCRLLSIGSMSNPDETDEQNHDLRIECIKELHLLTKSSNHEIAVEAWKSLGNYEMIDLEEALNVSPAALCSEYINLPKEQQSGFVEFLDKCIEKEVESYQRPLYSSGSQTAELPPLLSKVDTFKDNLSAKYKGEAWFWSATLPLSGYILELTSSINKAVATVRLLKSCLMNVPPATTHEEMIRIVAGWRICVKETLNALSESKSNDILWARDQICQEGRLSLTQKSESVDNIMIMLTVLADAIEEKLKFADDQNHVEEVTKSQKPWVISVFEFIATRLPKEVKQKREQKANPIIQLITNSNKSSLFIALFCARLLYRNHDIMEFYHDENELGIAEDPMFTCFLKDPTVELKNEEVPDRKMMWISAEAYGVDELTVNKFETTYQRVIDEKTKIDGHPSLENNDDVREFFSQLVLAPRKTVQEIQQKNRKQLEKLWNSGNDDMKRNIYEGLSELALVSGSQRKKKTVAIAKLPDSTVLKSVLQLFEDKHHLDQESLQNLFLSLPNHKRKDDRFLPPMDWLNLLKIANWKNADGECRSAILSLACEQNISEVIYNYSDKLSVKELLIIAEHLQGVSKQLPRITLLSILGQMLKEARTNEDEATRTKLAIAVAKHQKNPIVRMLLIKELPSLVDTIGTIDPILKTLTDPSDFVGTVSSCFDVWLEARNGEKMNIKRICDLVNVTEDTSQKCSMYALISLEARQLSTKKRFDKILDVITASRISRSQSTDMSSFLPIVLSLIVAPSPDVDIPVFWFGNEKNVLQILDSGLKSFFESIFKHSQMNVDVKHIGSFLRPYIEGDETGFYEQWQRDVASDMLLTLFTAFPSDALPNLLDESDSFWESILQRH